MPVAGIPGIGTGGENCIGCSRDFRLAPMRTSPGSSGTGRSPASRQNPARLSSESDSGTATGGVPDGPVGVRLTGVPAPFADDAFDLVLARVPAHFSAAADSCASVIGSLVTGGDATGVPDGGGWSFCVPDMIAVGVWNRSSDVVLLEVVARSRLARIISSAVRCRT